jgi:long-chain fatty acid transport protein
VRLPVFAAAGALVAAAGSAEAGGFGVTELSARGLGRANSGEAAASGVEARGWNAAAIARTPRQASIGLSRHDDSTVFSDRGSTLLLPVPPAGLSVPVGGASNISDGVPDMTTAYGAAAMPIGERFALGLSVSQPYRLRTELGDTAWARYDTIRSKIQIADIQLTGAVQATDWLDLGLGLDAQRNEAALDQAFPNLAPGAADGVFRLAADGWGYGWTAGAQAHAERLTVGLSYRAAIKHKLDGGVQLSGLVAPLDGANFAAPATARFSTPWIVTAAARWAATPALTLNAQVVRSGWSRYDVIAVTFGGQTVAIPQNFKDTTSLAVGLDYRLNPTWVVRAGVQNDPTPTPDSLREPGVFDADRRIYAVGASAELSPSATLHGALAYTDFADAVLVDNDVFYAGTPAQTTARSRGLFSGHGVSASAALNLRF